MAGDAGSRNCQGKRMRIAVVLQSPREYCSMRKCPRGMVAVPAYWHAMGHDVLVTFREDMTRPFRLLRMIRRFKPDIIVTSWLVAPLVVLWRRLGLLPCPVVHAWDDHYAEMSSFPSWLVWPFECLSVRFADFVTSPSRSNLIEAIRMGRPVCYIPHGSDPITVRPEGGPELAGSFKIVYSGDQSAYKKTGDLVAAVAGLPCDLYLFGTVNESLRASAPANVHFMGVIPQVQLPAVYAQADLLAITADQDSAFKVFEYLRAGRPILGRMGRLSTMLEHGKTAWLTSDFREALEYLIAHPADLERLADNMKRIPCFTWRQVAMIFADLLANIIEKGPLASNSPVLDDNHYAGYARISEGAAFVAAGE